MRTKDSWDSWDSWDSRDSCSKINSEWKIREIREIRVQKSTQNERFVRFERFMFKNQHSTLIIKSMDLRSYTKQELALLYFPDSDPDVARSHLMRWIVRCTQLYEQLLKSGYTKNSKEFNPLQVSYIFFHLGEPWYLSVIIGEYRGATLSIGELGMRNVVSLHCDSEREVPHGSHRSHGFFFVASNGYSHLVSMEKLRRSKNPWDPWDPCEIKTLNI